MPRAHLYRTITDIAGNLRGGATVRVLYPGTTTLMTEPIYPADSGSDTLPNPFSSSTGVIDFYLEEPRRVRLGIKFPNESERFFNDVDVMLPFDEGAPIHGHPYASETHTHGGEFAGIGHTHPATTVDLVPTGTVAATNLQDAVLELDQDRRTHETATDPHPQYLTAAEGDALFLTQAEGDARYIRFAGMVSTTVAYTMTVDDGQVLASGAITVTLPDATLAQRGRRYSVKNIGPDIVTVASTLGTIDNGATAQIAVQYESLDFISDGTNWWVF